MDFKILILSGILFTFGLLSIGAGFRAQLTSPFEILLIIAGILLLGGSIVLTIQTGVKSQKNT